MSQGLCHTMRRQIISRAFYGWLTYTRHVNIVRKHLAGELTTKSIWNGIIVSDIKLLETPEGETLKNGLTSNVWRELISHTNQRSTDERMEEIHARIYYGGIEDSLRL